MNKYKAALISLLIILIISLSICSINASSITDIGTDCYDDNSIVLEDSSIQDNLLALDSASSEEDKTASNENDLDLNENLIEEDDSQNDYPVFSNNNLNSDSASFTELQNLIDNSGDYLELNYSYAFKSGDNANGILIDKDITIDGKGNTLNGSYAGRVFNISQSKTLTLKNLNIVNANSTFCGGAIYSEGNIMANNVNFTNNRIRGALYDHVYSNDYDSFHGGAIYSTGSNQFVNCYFNNNIGEIGGAIYSTGNCSFEGCRFYKNKAVGGQQYQMSCEFDYILLGGEGAAVYCFGNSSFKDTEFIENFADLEDARGTGVIFLGAYSTIDNCTFRNNDANSMVYWLFDGTIVNSSFIDNYGYEFGAIYFGGNGTIDSCNFANNSRAHYGGAIYALGNIEYVDDSGENFIYLDSDITIKNCNFTNNSAFMNGGAICLYGGTTVLNCNFTGNRVNVTDFREFNEYYDYYDFSNESKGGAIYIDNGNVINCNFINNVAYLDGGAIFNLNNAILANNSFSLNRADSKGNEIYNFGILSLSNNTIINQDSDYVGIYNENFFGNGLIVSPLSLIILENKTYYIRDIDEFNVSLRLLDDNGNPIEDTRIILMVYSNGLDGDDINLGNLDYDRYIAYFNNETHLFEYALTEWDSDLILLSADYEGSDNLNVMTSMISKGLIQTKINSTIDATDSSAVAISLSLATVEGESINETVTLVITDEGGTVVSSQEIVVNGSTNVIVRDLAVGNYNVSISFKGSDVYDSCENINGFSINKISPPLLIDLIYSELNNNLEISISLGNVNGTVTLFITNLDCIYLNLTEGIGKVSLSNLKAGNYTVFAVFEGNDYCDYAWNKKDFFVVPLVHEKLATSFEFSNMETVTVNSKVDGYIGKYFNVILKDSNGNKLSNKAVQMGFNGVIYNLITDETGLARLQINLGYAGTYTFAIAFLGDEDFNASFAVAKITVKKQSPKLSVSNKSYKSTAKTKTLTATLKSSKGNPISGKSLTFTVNGKKYTAKTNSKGVASVKVSLSKKKTYSFSVKLASDSTYSAVTKSAKVTIK